MFYQGAVLWKCLEHTNIVSLLGITPTPFQLISEWMVGGDLREYIKQHPDADRLGLVGVPPPHLGRCVYPFMSYVISQTAFITSTPATWFMEISRGYVIIYIFHYHLDVGSAEHPYRCHRSCTNHGFLACYGYSRPRLRTERLERSGPHRAMDRTGDLKRSRNI